MLCILSCTISIPFQMIQFHSCQKSRSCLTVGCLGLGGAPIPCLSLHIGQGLNRRNISKYFTRMGNCFSFDLAILDGMISSRKIANDNWEYQLDLLHILIWCCQFVESMMHKDLIIYMIISPVGGRYGWVCHCDQSWGQFLGRTTLSLLVRGYKLSWLIFNLQNEPKWE